jgi:hypothetical protein
MSLNSHAEYAVWQDFVKAEIARKLLKRHEMTFTAVT